MKIASLGGRVVLLSDVSWRDRKFQRSRTGSLMVAELYKGTKYNHYGLDISNCGTYLVFKKIEIVDALGISRTKLLLRAANFCRNRFCITCQWRRSLMWHGRMLEAVPVISEIYPEHRWVSWVLGIRNCDPKVLRREIKCMNDAFSKLLGTRGGDFRKRGVGKYIYPIVEGYICTTEITRGKDNSCHPHFHIMLLVKPEYFRKETGLYIPQQSGEEYENPGLVELWQEALGVSYRPTAYVKAVRTDDLTRQVCQVLKYNTKPSSVWYQQRVDEKGLHRIGFEETQKWLLEVTTQIHGSRFIKTGGCIKKLIRGLESEPEDLIHCNEESEYDLMEGETLTFGWINNNFHGLDMSYYALVDNETKELLVFKE
jgi:plasmid rolling circle replication initiator protein Rep